MSDSADKLYYKIGEVCEVTGTQPYVLRFWESEFPTLAPQKNRSGQRVYRKRDIDLIHRIKTLLYEQEYTIAGARKVLEGELGAENLVRDGTEESSSANRDDSPSRHRSATRGRGDSDEGHPTLPLGGSDETGHQLEVEVKNLRAKLSRVEGELRSLLADMDRRDPKTSAQPSPVPSLSPNPRDGSFRES